MRGGGQTVQRPFAKFAREHGFNPFDIQLFYSPLCNRKLEKMKSDAIYDAVLLFQTRECRMIANVENMLLVAERKKHHRHQLKELNMQFVSHNSINHYLVCQW